MINKFAVLLGGNILNTGVYEKFKKQNLFVIVVDWNEYPSIVGDMHLRMDVKDFKAIIDELSKMNLNSANFVIAYTSIDLAVISVNYINKYFNKFYTPIEIIKNVESKEMMKMNWETANLFNRVSYTLSNIKDIDRILNTFNSDNILLKPSISSSSNGLSIVDKNNKKQIIDSFNIAKEISLDNKVMVEEFVEGTEYTVELLGDNFGNVSVYGISKKYHTKNAGSNKIAIKLHYNPNDVSESNLNQIAQFGIKCYKSLGLKNCFGHLEVIQKNNNEIVPIEIGARSSGFIASTLVDIVSGHDYIHDYISIINGGQVENNKFYKSNFSSMYYFYDIPVNKVGLKTTNLMEYIDKNIISLYSNRKLLKEKNTFELINNDNARVGYEILSGDKSKLTINNVLSAENQFLKTFIGESNEIL